MEQERRAPDIRRARRPGSGLWGQGGTDPEPTAPMATVTHGPYAEQVPVANMTVGQIRQRFGARFDIDPESQPYIEGEPVSNDTVVQADQVLMFARRAGEKGGPR